MLILMSIPDLINGIFEFVGGLAVWWNVRAIWKDKHFSGTRISPSFFFASWCLWNLYYYPYLHQWISFFAGISIGLANLVYVILMFLYKGNAKDARIS